MIAPSLYVMYLSGLLKLLKQDTKNSNNDNWDYNNDDDDDTDNI